MLEKGTAKMSKMAIGLSYFNGHLLTGIMAIRKGPTAMAIDAVGYFEPWSIIIPIPIDDM